MKESGNELFYFKIFFTILLLGRGFMEAFKKILKGRTNLVFIDFEGTQFSHEIIAVGCSKVKCDLNGMINSKNNETYKRYVKCYGTVGKIVSEMTSIDNDKLKNEGVTLEEMLKEIEAFVGDELTDTAFIVFGSNDIKMLVDSINFSKPSSDYIGYNICKRTIDFQSFISQFIKDKNGNNYSLTNYLKIFNVDPFGQSHDPLNDAIDLMNLYDAFMKDKSIKDKEYLQVLKNQKVFPTPVRKMINKLINGENVSSEEFKKEVHKYLE